MKWHFADLNTLRDLDSGYEIHLESGTWYHPKRLRPRAPGKMSFSTQLKLLRKGLAHIKSIGNYDAMDKQEKVKNTAA